MRLRKLVNQLSFQHKLILIVSILTVGICSVAILQVQNLSRRHFLHRFYRNIESTREVIKKVLEERQDLLQKSAQQMGENPRLLAALSTDDPRTLQDLIEDELEGFSVFFREHDGVLLYKRSKVNPSRWIRFDHHQIPFRDDEIQGLLQDLDEVFTTTKTNRWKGQLPITHPNQPTLFLAGAYDVFEENAILICANRLDIPLAFELRNLTLDVDDHLIFASGSRLLCSTLNPNEEEELTRLLLRSDPQPVERNSNFVKDIKLAGNGYFGFMDSFIDFDSPLPSDGRNEGILCIILKSRNELDYETAELKRSLLLVGGGGFLLAILLASIVSKNLARPIQNLVDFVGKFSEGTLGNRLNLDDYHGEFSELARAFDDMQVSLEKKNRELLQADKMASLGTLSAGIAHEINNPNQYILTNTTILNKFFDSVKPVLDRYQKEHSDFSVNGIPYSEIRERIPAAISALRKGSERIKRIVDGLRDFARQNPDEKMKNVDLNSVVRSAGRLVETMVRKSTEHFIMNLAPDLPEIQGNFQRLEQVVINILINACQALTDKSKRIEILTTYDCSKDTVILKVIDEGRGVSIDDQRHIFDPFFTAQRDHVSTGLGLSISKSIIDKHGATIDFNSELGKGTTLTLKFPMSKTSTYA